MTDTSRPTVEALIAWHRGHFQGGTADVLGALLTERDNLSEGVKSFMRTVDRIADERDAARAQIAKIGGYAALDNSTLGSLIRAILRGVQEATERPGQPGKNGGERAGLVGRESLPVAAVAALAATEPSEPSAYARFAKIASRFPADIAKEIGLWMRSAGYDPTEEGEHERWAKDYNMPHEFRPVAGHPDDDECTDRRDGTDATYCGLPRRLHGYPRPEPSEQVVWPLDRPWGSENAEPTEPSDILVQDVHATEQKRYTEPWQDPETNPRPSEGFVKALRAVYDAETKGPNT